jgi:nucleoid-associated protein YgaU
MRTEIKIGIIVGLVVVAGGIIFFVNQGKKTAGNVTDVLPMDAPAGKAAPTAGKTEPPRKPGDNRPTTPARATGPEKPPVTAQRPPVTTPLTRPAATPAGPTTQPTGARPLVAAPPTAATPRPGELAPGPTPGPEAARPTPTPAERESTTQPRPPAELPPLAGPTGSTAGISPTPAGPSGESVLSGATGASPGVSLPPRKEIEPATAMPPPAPERTAPAANAAKYTVTAGDSLWSIAEEHYGDGHLWTKLKAANPGIEENVKVGQVLNLPPKEELLGPAKGAKPAAKPEAASGEAKPGAKPATQPADAKPAAQPHTYVAESGDTLFKIAAKVLGNGHRWRELLELNKDKLAEPEDLKVGMELRVPAKEGQTEKVKSEPAKPETKKNGTKKSEPSKSGGSKKS